MRAMTIGFAALAAAALVGCNKGKDQAVQDETGPEITPRAAEQAPLETPARKAGLWEQTVSSNGGAQTIRICTDAATERQMAWWGGTITQGACTENTATRGADGAWSFRSVCDMGSAGQQTTTGAITGDFESRYEIKAQSTTTGSVMPGGNGTHPMTITAAYKGACPEGWLPGDMEMPGGMRMNMVAGKALLEQIAKSQKTAP